MSSAAHAPEAPSAHDSAPHKGAHPEAAKAAAKAEENQKKVAGTVDAAAHDAHGKVADVVPDALIPDKPEEHLKHDFVLPAVIQPKVVETLTNAGGAAVDVVKTGGKIFGALAFPHVSIPYLLVKGAGKVMDKIPGLRRVSAATRKVGKFALDTVKKPISWTLDKANKIVAQPLLSVAKLHIAPVFYIAERAIDFLSDLREGLMQKSGLKHTKDEKISLPFLLVQKLKGLVELPKWYLTHLIKSPIPTVIGTTIAGLTTYAVLSNPTLFFTETIRLAGLFKDWLAHVLTVAPPVPPPII